MDDFFVKTKNYLLKIISEDKKGVLPFVIKTVLYFLALLFYLAVRFRNALFDWGIKKKTTLDSKVISLGNITTGGTGKTPATASLAEYFQKQKKKVVVVSRGYHGENQRPLIVSDGENMMVGAGLAGDEAYMLARKLENVPVVICRDKTRAALFAEQEFAPDVILLDDGFQHRSVARDFDLVLIDATQPFGHGYMLPRGLLREPLTSLKRADGVVITRSDLVSPARLSSITARVKKYFRGDFIYLAHHAPFGLQSFAGKRYDLSLLADSKVVSFSGLANSSGFTGTLENLGAEIIKHFDFPDHHNYSREHMKEIVEFFLAKQDIDFLITTRKDMVKFGEDIVDFLKIKKIDPIRLEIKMVFNNHFPGSQPFADRLAASIWEEEVD